MNKKYPYLDEALLTYTFSDYYPFHMPGHKRQPMGSWSPESMDITEIDGFDNLHHAVGILNAAQERMAVLCGADRSFYLVNGSTAGILTAICSSVQKGDRILIARNCHKAVYHAVYLMELTAEYLYPMPAAFGIQGSISPQQVEDMLTRYSDIRAVVITSPTYDGVVSDITSIADIVHARQIPLIVDEAHGAHFGFSPGFPRKALALGADLCIESLHKTLPSYTQTAVLHCTGNLVNISRIQLYLGIFQTSSPSYIFMAGMDRCTRILQRRRNLFTSFEKRLKHFYQASESLKNIAVLRKATTFRKPSGQQTQTSDCDPAIYDRDLSKILITDRTGHLSGPALYHLLLQDYHLQMEMESGHYVTALTSIMDTDDGFERLIQALRKIDARISQMRTETSEDVCPECPDSTPVQLTPTGIYRKTLRKLTIALAMNARKRSVKLENSTNCISAEFLYLYPPGIPILVPGEQIDTDTLQIILQCRSTGLSLQGLSDVTGAAIEVVVQEIS